MDAATKWLFHATKPVDTQQIRCYMQHLTRTRQRDAFHKMDHFPIIQALCRAALAQPSPAVRKQIERLRDALTREGDAKSAGVLTGLLTAADRTTEISPSRIVQARAQVAGETIT